jgi:predicted nucleic acid-binding Zn ribbon protein
MKRRNAQPLSEVLKDFLSENTELYEKMMEIRIRRGWGELLGPVILQYTRNLYIKNQVLYVSLNSSVLRNELIYSREKLIKSLNDYAGSTVIHDIVIR